MANRINAKKEKRKRNKENMRKFKKPVSKVRGKNTSAKSSAQGVKRAAAREAEAAFVAKLFTAAVPGAEGAVTEQKS